MNDPWCLNLTDAGNIKFHESANTQGLLLLFGASTSKIGIVELNNLSSGIVEVTNARSIQVLDRFHVYSVFELSNTFGIGLIGRAAFFEIFNEETRRFELEIWVLRWALTLWLVHLVCQFLPIYWLAHDVYMFAWMYTVVSAHFGWKKVTPVTVTKQIFVACVVSLKRLL